MLSGLDLFLSSFIFTGQVFHCLKPEKFTKKVDSADLFLLWDAENKKPLTMFALQLDLQISTKTSC